MDNVLFMQVMYALGYPLKYLGEGSPI